MPGLELVRRVMRRWFTSILFFAVLGLILGGLIAIPVIPKPNVATITISGEIREQAHADDISNMLRYAEGEAGIRAVVLQIDSPGGLVVTSEQIYMDVLRLRQQKPVVVSVGAMGASGAYHIAVASNFIYAEPTSQLGSIGAVVQLPGRLELDEDVLTTGPFKSTGGSRGKYTDVLEVVRQKFVTEVIAQRGDRLRLSEEELSRAEVYTGIESLRYGLIDDIGTRIDAIEKAAQLAHIRNYGVVELYISEPTIWFWFSSLKDFF